MSVLWVCQAHGPAPALGRSTDQHGLTPAGFGQYLLLTPAIAGLEAMRLRLRDNDTCLR